MLKFNDKVKVIKQGFYEGCIGIVRERMQFGDAEAYYYVHLLSKENPLIVDFMIVKFNASDLQKV